MILWKTVKITLSPTSFYMSNVIKIGELFAGQGHYDNRSGKLQGR